MDAQQISFNQMWTLDRTWSLMTYENNRWLG